MKYSRKGFTLIELIIVIIIIGVLAAIAAPMMSGNVKKAHQSEAIAALGSLRTAERCYKAETGAYGAITALGAYVNQTDLEGTYYGSGNYSLSGSLITATPKAGGAGGDGSVNMDVNTGALSNS